MLGRLHDSDRSFKSSGDLRTGREHPLAGSHGAKGCIVHGNGPLVRETGGSNGRSSKVVATLVWYKCAGFYYRTLQHFPSMISEPSICSMPAACARLIKMKQLNSLSVESSKHSRSHKKRHSQRPSTNPNTSTWSSRPPPVLPRCAWAAHRTKARNRGGTHIARRRSWCLAAARTQRSHHSSASHSSSGSWILTLAFLAGGSSYNILTVPSHHRRCEGAARKLSKTYGRGAGTGRAGGLGSVDHLLIS